MASNTLLTIDQITREALDVLHANLGFTRTVNRQYDDSFAKKGAKIGTTLRIRKPPKYAVTKSATLSTSRDSVEEYTTLTVSTQAHVPLEFSSLELTMKIDDLRERFLQPAMAVLAATVDADGLALYKDVYNSVGTPGTTPSTALSLLLAQEKLDLTNTPRDGRRYATVNPTANAYLVDGLKGLFHNGDTISKQFKKGLMGMDVLGLKEITMDQNVNRHTVGTVSTATKEIKGAITTSTSTISVDGFDASQTGAIKAGDVFTIEGAYAVNPETKTPLSVLQQFVAKADANSDSTSTASITIDPPIIFTGARQTVSAASDQIADNADVTFVGSSATAYSQNLVYHEDSFTLATADLVLPEGVHMGSRAVMDGISLRIVFDYDITEDRFLGRADVLYGWLCQRPETACRLWGE